MSPPITRGLHEEIMPTNTNKMDRRAILLHMCNFIAALFQELPKLIGQK